MKELRENYSNSQLTLFLWHVCFTFKRLTFSIKDYPMLISFQITLYHHQKSLYLTLKTNLIQAYEENAFQENWLKLLHRLVFSPYITLQFVYPLNTECLSYT